MKKQLILIFMCATFAVLFFSPSSIVLGENLLGDSAKGQYGFVSLGKNISLKVEKIGERFFISGSGFHPYEIVRLFITAPPDFDFKNEVWFVYSDVNGEINSEREDFLQNYGTDSLTITAQGTVSKLAASIKIPNQNIQLTPQADPNQGELRIVKHANPPRAAPFDFTTTNLTPSAFFLVANSATEDPRRVFRISSSARQTYTVTESADQYNLVDISCVFFRYTPADDPTFSRNGSTISIEMNNQNAVSCTFVNNLTPTAAAVSVSGRVFTANGRGILNARISVTDASGNTRTVLSNPFGYYRFDELPAGQTYVFQAQAKRFQFTNPTQVLSVNEDVNEVNFIGFMSRFQ